MSHPNCYRQAMSHGETIGRSDRSRPCWQCEHFVALTEGGSAFCIQGGNLRAQAEAKGCAFHRPGPIPEAPRPQPVSFCDAWRRVPRSITRPPEVMALLIADRREQRSEPTPGAGWRNGEEHQWSRDPG
jgi:hypothetical protein